MQISKKEVFGPLRSPEHHRQIRKNKQWQRKAALLPLTKAINVKYIEKGHQNYTNFLTLPSCPHLASSPSSPRLVNIHI